jgi:hypothetical protein
LHQARFSTLLVMITHLDFAELLKGEISRVKMLVP